MHGSVEWLQSLNTFCSFLNYPFILRLDGVRIPYLFSDKALEVMKNTNADRISQAEKADRLKRKEEAAKKKEQDKVVKLNFSI